MKKFPLVCMLSVALCACGKPTKTTDQTTDEAAEQLPAETNGPPPPPEEPMSEDNAGASDSSTPAEIEGVTNKRLNFERGASSIRIEDSIEGYEIVDYLLRINSGQAMSISLASTNTAAYFNLLEPGETEAAFFNGSMGANMFEGVAARSGDYRIRVYLYRSAARRNEAAPYILEIETR